MSAAFKGRVKECVYYLERYTLAQYSCAEAEHVCIVVAACHLSGECVRAYCRTDTLVLVCRHRHTDTCTADKDAKLSFALLNIHAYLVGVFGIVYRVGGMCTVVGIFDTSFFKVLDNVKLKVICRLIAGNSYYSFTHCFVSFPVFHALPGML